VLKIQQFKTHRKSDNTTDRYHFHRNSDIIALLRYYRRRLCRSAWVGFSSPSVCLFARSIIIIIIIKNEKIRVTLCENAAGALYIVNNSKTNDPKVFKLGIGNDLRIP